MMNNLCIRLLSSQEGGEEVSQFQWALSNEEDEFSQYETGTVDELSAYLALKADGSGKVVLLVPAEEVLLNSVVLPTRRLSQIKQALPFVIEEQLADELENTHFAMGPRAQSNHIHVAAVSHKRMKGWLDLFRNTSIKIDYMISEILLLPFDSDQWTVLVESNKALIRTGSYSGLAVTPGNLKHALEIILNSEDKREDNKKSQKIELYYEVGIDSSSRLELIESELIHSYDVEINSRQIDKTVFQLMCTYLAQQGVNRLPMINLLQEQYSPLSAANNKPQWRKFALVATFCFLFQLGFFLIQAVYLHHRADLYDQKSVALYKELFPQDKCTFKLKKRIKIHLSS